MYAYVLPRRLQDVRTGGIIIICKMCGQAATVQLNSAALMATHSQARLAGVVTRQEQRDKANCVPLKSSFSTPSH
jgi:hypothetical protein